MAGGVDTGTCTGSEGRQLIPETWAQTWQLVQLSFGGLSGPSLASGFTISPQFLICEMQTRSCFKEQTPPGHATQAWLPP